jgi:hypothetical protein
MVAWAVANAVAGVQEWLGRDEHVQERPLPYVLLRQRTRKCTREQHMVDGIRVLADVQAKKIQASWRVLRRRRWRALNSGIAAALVVMFAILNFVSNFDMFPFFASALFHWLLVLGIGSVGVVMLVIPIVQSGRHAVVLLPDGFVDGNPKSGTVYRSVTYSALSHMSLGWADLGAMGLLMRPVLSWEDTQGHATSWTVPAYVSVPPMRLATSVLIQYLQAHGARSSPDELPDTTAGPMLSAAELIAHARTGQAPSSWQVIQLRQRPTRWTRWQIRYLAIPVMVFTFAVLLGAWGALWYLLYAALFNPALIQSPSPLARAGEGMFCVFLLVLLTLALGFCMFYLWPLLRAYRQIKVVTSERVVLGDRYTGAVFDTFDWKDVVDVDVMQRSAISVLRFRLAGRKPVTLLFYISPNGADPRPYYTQPTDQIVQAVIERFAMSRSRLAGG